ncbi:MAG: hypothetical protein Q8R14_01370 [Candidatus Omnitrophota bacterium]|nr:hypothetical protein [Candidatus Omnitrophota bacterium]
MKKNIIVTLIISLAIMAGVLVMSTNSLRAQAAAPDQEISKKLDDILSNQKTILQGMADLKQELYIIKIRVTQQQ